MQRRFAPVAALCSLLAMVATPVFALNLDAFDFSSPREKAMGGTHVALADDFSVLLTNPAGLADVPSKFSAADLGVRAIGPVFDIANLIMGGNTSPTAIMNFLAANNYKLYAGLDISGPVAFGYTGGGLGFGLFNKTGLTANVASVSSIGVKAVEDLLLAGGYAMHFDLGKGQTLAAGVSTKGFVRGDISPTIGAIEAMDLISNPMALLAKPFNLTTGIGIDAGLRWSWKDQVAAGLACRDAFSPALVTKYSSMAGFLGDPANSKLGSSTYETLRRSLDFGFSWSPSLGRLGQILDSLVIALDYRDILDLANPVPRNPILNVGVGMELKVLDIVSIRAGMDNTLLSVGMGLDLGVFTLNVAAFGKELGLDPGNRPYYNLLIDFDFKY